MMTYADEHRHPTEIRLVGEQDASVWAEEFALQFRGKGVPDEGVLTAWFANAIMSGVDHAIRAHNETDERMNQIGWRLAVFLGKVDPDKEETVHADIDEMLDELEARAVVRTPRTKPASPFTIEDDNTPNMIASAVGQYGGYLSMCWEYPWDSGIFESDLAKDATDTLVNYLNDKM